jgi:hypothetical protein
VCVVGGCGGEFGSDIGKPESEISDFSIRFLVVCLVSY